MFVNIRLFSRRWVAALLGLALLLSQSGCGAGAVLSGIGIDGLSDDDDSGGTNQLPVIVGLEVLETKTSPAIISFTLKDVEADPVGVEIVYQPPGGGEEDFVLLDPPRDLRSLRTSKKGVLYELPWDFKQQRGKRFTEGYTVTVRAGESSDSKDDVDLGNDRPVLVLDEGEREKGQGDVGVRFAVYDSSDDQVSIQVEYAVVVGQLPSRAQALCDPPEGFCWTPEDRETRASSGTSPDPRYFQWMSAFPSWPP